MTDNAQENKAQRINNPLRLKRLYSVKEAATYLGRGEDSMNELIDSREILVVQRSKRGKRWLDVMDLDKWIETNKHLAGERR